MHVCRFQFPLHSTFLLFVPFALATLCGCQVGTGGYFAASGEFSQPEQGLESEEVSVHPSQTGAGPNTYSKKFVIYCNKQELAEDEPAGARSYDCEVKKKSFDGVNTMYLSHNFHAVTWLKPIPKNEEAEEIEYECMGVQNTGTLRCTFYPETLEGNPNFKIEALVKSKAITTSLAANNISQNPSENSLNMAPTAIATNKSPELSPNMKKRTTEILVSNQVMSGIFRPMPGIIWLAYD